MAMAVYGIEAIWEGHLWIVQSFHKLTAQIGRDVLGTFASTMRVDAIRVAATPPIRAALDRRTERQFISLSQKATSTHSKITSMNGTKIQSSDHWGDG
jgi:hypothetical protein